MSETQTLAMLGWSADIPPAGLWRLRIVLPSGDYSMVYSEWDQVGPPSLMQRYDALAGLGYAVVEGGPDAWRWGEGLSETGGLMVAATTPIRLLTDREATAQAQGAA
ncbi:DUF6303 family protein [Streptomyces deccanensis]|uniref:DUF6303 family protein n=1 Tax=Streptomyces deccanensis TaxID=424188 RepID=UPI001EFAAAE6|nr:DUF6303 family protein [Streptomyces deccanensis]ULR50587.1 DUF6303 family protein [Streptomyces deccanensis]